MPLNSEPGLLVEPYDKPERQSLAWVDAMLHAVEVDVQRREALARASRQDTISLVLTGQAALLVRLRAAIHSRYWSLRNGDVAKEE